MKTTGLVGGLTWYSDIDYYRVINQRIYEELGKGILLPGTIEKYLVIISNLVELGAGSVILGCTGIPLLVKQGDSPVPVFETTWLHAAGAFDFALA